MQVLDEIVLYQSGSFKRVRRYLRGIHPERGCITKGLSGWETIEETDVIIPIKKFQIAEIKDGKI